MNLRIMENMAMHPFRAALAISLVVLSGVGFAQVKPDEPIKTTLCDLVKQPERFNGKMVQVRATVNTGFEWNVLQDEFCHNEAIWLEFGVTKNSIFGDAVEFAYISSPGDVNYPETLQWKPTLQPPHVKLVKDSQFRKLSKYLGKEEDIKRTGCIHCPLYNVTATLTGGFEVSDGRLKALRSVDGKTRVPPNAFGHLNGWASQLVLESVSDVVGKPVDHSVYKKNK
jgi:hypothetical protein